MCVSFSLHVSHCLSPTHTCRYRHTHLLSYTRTVCLCEFSVSGIMCRHTHDSYTHTSLAHLPCINLRGGEIPKYKERLHQKTGKEEREKHTHLQFRIRATRIQPATLDTLSLSPTRWLAHSHTHTLSSIHTSSSIFGQHIFSQPHWERLSCR